MKVNKNAMTISENLIEKIKKNILPDYDNSDSIILLINPTKDIGIHLIYFVCFQTGKRI